MSETVVGIDGCKSGWICVSRAAEDAPQVAVFATFHGVLKAFPDDATFVVDMPIGLPKMTGTGGRPAESAVRQLPSVPNSSVFAIPSRAAVHAECGPFKSQTERLAAHQRAVLVGRSTSTSNAGFSIQAFCIFPKIREIDDLLVEKPSLRGRVFESHPEVAFRSLNGWSAITPKKIKHRQNPLGIAERKEILGRHGFAPEFLDRKPPPKVGVDDFLDAACMMVVAARKFQGIADRYPPEVVSDDLGIPIAIWA